MRAGAAFSCFGFPVRWLPVLLLALAVLPASWGAAQEGEENDPALLAEEADLFGEDDLFSDEDADLFGEVDSEDPEAALSAEEPKVGEAIERAPDSPDPSPEARDPAIAETPIEVSPVVTGPTEGIEELLIHGEAGLDIEIDAGQSVTLFSADDLQAMGVESVADVAQFTPNLEIRTAGSTTATFFIRGVGLNDFTANGSGAVAIYQDDVALNLPAFQLGQIFDTENIAVEKGPQGSGPGRNASAGAIRIFSRKPTGEYGAFARVDVGNHEYIDAEGALEVPLFADLLSTRLAFRLTQRQGLVDNRCGGLSQAQIDAANGRPCGNSLTAAALGLRPGLTEKLNDINTWAARGTLRLLPPDTDMEWLLNVHFSRIDQAGFVGDQLGTAGERLGSNDQFNYQQREVSIEQQKIFARFPNPPPPTVCRPPRGSPTSPECLERNRIVAARDAAVGKRLAERPLGHKPFEGDYNNPGHERQETLGGYLRGDWQLDRARLITITGAERYQRDRILDADYSPNRLFEFKIDDHAYQVTQDLRAEGELDMLPVTWGVGGFLLAEELNFQQVTLAAPTIFGIDQKFTQETLGFGIYGEFTWEFLDDFELGGGVRYNWERRRMDADIEVQQSDACAPVLGFDPACVATATFDAPTGTISLKYHLNDATSVSWKYSRGWKGSQFNTRDGTLRADIIDIADPEKIDAFEVGFSGEWFDGGLSLDGALFWYSYDDYQVFQFTNNVNTPPQRIVLNAEDAQLYGGELEVRLEPLDDLVADIRLGWLESKFLDFSDTGTRTVPGSDMFSSVILQQTVDYTGNRFPNAPRFKVSGSLEYTADLGRFGYLIPRYDFSWTDDVFFDSSEGQGAPGLFDPAFLPDYTIAQRAYALQNFRLTYRSPSGNLEISGWVRNFTNELYKTLSFDASQSVNLVGNLVGDPRTFGGSITVSF